MGPGMLLAAPSGATLHTGRSIRVRPGDGLVAHARKSAKKARGKASAPSDADPSTSRPARIALELEQELPQAPSPSTKPYRSQVVAPEQIYPVFAPKPGEDSSNAPWRWDEQGELEEPESRPPEDYALPPWNPKTGFSRPAAELEASADAGSATSSGTGSAAGDARGGSSGASGSGRPARPPLEVSLTTPPEAAVASASSPDAMPLPPASRNVVLSSALGTGFWMTILAIVLRNFVAMNSTAALGADPAAVEALLRWPLGLESLLDVGVTLGSAAAVTGARKALMSVWPDLRAATNRANQQVLTMLGPGDIFVIALASGIPEELLFRGAIIPGTFPDWRGLLIASATFGLLHNSGGRNMAFAAWAGAVGGLYGAAFLVTGNVWVPAFAHVGANMASAYMWKARKAEEARAEREGR